MIFVLFFMLKSLFFIMFLVDNILLKMFEELKIILLELVEMMMKIFLIKFVKDIILILSMFELLIFEILFIF